MRNALTTTEVGYARDWLADCFTDLPSLTDAEVIDGIRRLYDGGIRQFVLDVDADGPVAPRQA